MSESKLSSTPDELEKLFMDPNRAKTEAEHWAVREIEKLRAENERLRAALKPFAVEAEAYDPPEGDDAEPAWASRFTCGNLRDARKAWKGEP